MATKTKPTTVTGLNPGDSVQYAVQDADENHVDAMNAGGLVYVSLLGVVGSRGELRVPSLYFADAAPADLWLVSIGGSAPFVETLERDTGGLLVETHDRVILGVPSAAPGSAGGAARQQDVQLTVVKDDL